MDAGARPIGLQQAAGIVKHLGGPWARPFHPQETLGEPPQQGACTRRVTRGAPDIKTKPDGQIRHLSHAVGEGSKDFPALMNSKSNDQDTAFGDREHLTEDDPGITRGTYRIRTTCDQLDRCPSPPWTCIGKVESSR